jgi:prepilin-type N-terminal cleavage/methylation domain-containing protein
MRKVNSKERKRLRSQSDGGFSLIEVMASVTILAVFALGLVHLLGNMVIESTVAEQRDEAVAIARRFVNGFIDGGSESSIPAQFVSLQDAQNPDTFHVTDADLGADSIGHAYTVNVTFPPPPTGVAAQYVEVTVTWQTINQGTITPYSVHLEQAFAASSSH